MRRWFTWAAAILLIALPFGTQVFGPGRSVRQAEALGDVTHPFVLSSPIFSPKTGTSFTTLFTSIEDVSMSMLLRRYDAVGTLLTSQSITIGAHGSLQASPAAHSGAPLHVEIWAPLPHFSMVITYTDSSDVARTIPTADMIKPRGGTIFNVMAPFRICDTRASSSVGCTSGKVGQGGTRLISVTGLGGIPNQATSVVVNVTVNAATAKSFLTLYPSGTTRPNASNINFNAGDTLANLAIVKLGSDGKFIVYNNGGSTHVILDVAGYYI